MSRTDERYDFDTDGYIYMDDVTSAPYPIREDSRATYRRLWLLAGCLCGFARLWKECERAMRCQVILPTYNERANIGYLVREILAQGDHFNVLIVDDNSPDGTGQVAEQLAMRNERVRVLHRPCKLGLGTAYLAGFKDALANGADFIFEMDADFSHNPEDLQRLLAALADYDVVIGSRYVPGGGIPDWDLGRRLMSRGGNLYSRLLLGLPIGDCTSGFKGFHQQVLASLDLDGVAASGYAFQVEINYRCWQKGYRLGEIPILFFDRQAGRSKMSGRIVWEMLVLVWRLHRQRRHDLRPCLAKVTCSQELKRQP